MVIFQCDGYQERIKNIKSGKWQSCTCNRPLGCIARCKHERLTFSHPTPQLGFLHVKFWNKWSEEHQGCERNVQKLQCIEDCIVRFLLPGWPYSKIQYITMILLCSWWKILLQSTQVTREHYFQEWNEHLSFFVMSDVWMECWTFLWKSFRKRRINWKKDSKYLGNGLFLKYSILQCKEKFIALYHQ